MVLNIGKCFSDLRTRSLIPIKALFLLNGRDPSCSETVYKRPILILDEFLLIVISI